MGITKRVALAAAAICIAAASSSRADNFTVYGLGASTCAEYSEPGMRAQYENWLSGFLTGASLGSGRSLRDTEMSQALKIVDDYCARNPKANLSNAVEALFRKIR